MLTSIDIQPILREFKQALQEIYGERLAKVTLFGSYARGNFHEESDVDLLVVLKDKTISNFEEIKKTSPLVTDFMLKYSITFSPLITNNERFKGSKMPVFYEIRQEGKVL